MGNIFGTALQVMTWGESHGPAVGAVIDGLPSRIPINIDEIQLDLDRRRPARNKYASPRPELDEVSILSGLYEGQTLGTPLMLMVRNTSAHSIDYKGWENLYRPSHGDYTWQAKYKIRDPRGGGRCSARETVGRVVAGAVARQFLQYHLNISAVGWVDAIGGIQSQVECQGLTSSQIDLYPFRCPDTKITELWEKLLADVANSGDSLGGTISLNISGVPAGWGEPVFDKLQAQLAKAMMSIPAVRGVEFGTGMKSATMRGSEYNDEFMVSEGKIHTRTNNSGGIQGGISNGEDITLKVALKPVPTISKPQHTVNDKKEEIIYSFTGRHDICFVPRAVPIVEAMAYLVLADTYIMQKRQDI